MSAKNVEKKSQKRKIIWIVTGISVLVLLGIVSVFVSFQQIKGTFLPKTYSPPKDGERYRKMLTKGKFLIAGDLQKDPFFSKTVILLVKHNPEGAVGLIINRPTDLKLSKLLPGLDDHSHLKDETVYLGGPVQQNRLFLLVRSQNMPTHVNRILDDVYFSGRQEDLVKLTNSPPAKEKSHIFIGYAGWKAWQLEQEIAKGGWHIMPAESKLIFETPTANIWAELMEQKNELNK